MPDRIARDERFKSVERLWKIFKKLPAAAFEPGGQIHHQTADTEIPRRHASARSGFDQIQNLLALAKSEKENAHRAEIERARAEPDHMRRDALQFAEQNANNLRPLGDFQAEKFFRRHHIHEIVAEWIEIIHAVGDDDALLVFFVLEQLFHARVKIADVGNG